MGSHGCVSQGELKSYETPHPNLYLYHEHSYRLLSLHPESKILAKPKPCAADNVSQPVLSDSSPVH